MGTCCFSGSFIGDIFNTIPDGTNVVGDTADIAARNLLLINQANKVTCPSAYSNLGGAAVGKIGAATLGDDGTIPVWIAKATTGTIVHWWCSNGDISNSTTAKDSVVTSATITPGAASTNAPDTSTTNGDPRIEYFMINCRQRSDLCGAAKIVTPTAIGTYKDR